MNKNKKRKAKQKKREQARRKKKNVITTSKSNERKMQDIQYTERPPLSKVEAPEGFRAVSMSQAMSEYAEPLFDYIEKGVVQDPNEALQLAVPLWNYALSPNKEKLESDKSNTIRLIQQTLKMDKKQATEFFDMMVQRKDYLVPEDIQPDVPMTMFIRKEGHHLISEFNENELTLSDEPIPPDQEDKQLIQQIKRMDKCITDQTDYGEWEDHYFSMEEKFKERFKNWLEAKGEENYSEDFAESIEIYLHFIYQYEHFGDITLKNVNINNIEEFFTDFLLRKMVIEPTKYAKWIPVLKLSYRFLHEKGYLDNHKIIIRLIEKTKPLYIDILKERYE